MIILGIIFLLSGFIAKSSLFWVIGIVLVVVGAALVLLGAIGPLGGRRRYY